jgi:hypothetical protein
LLNANKQPPPRRPRLVVTEQAGLLKAPADNPAGAFFSARASDVCSSTCSRTPRGARLRILGPDDCVEPASERIGRVAAGIDRNRDRSKAVLCGLCPQAGYPALRKSSLRRKS